MQVKKIELIEVDECYTTMEECKSHFDLKTGIILAKTQTKGRGRKGKTFLSSEGGCYFSLFFDEEESFSNEKMPFLTMAMGLAVRKALLKFGKKTKIKWLNDILFKGKKCVGILAIRTPHRESHKIVIGVGVNLKNDLTGFENVATTLGNIASPSVLAQEISQNFFEIHERMKNGEDITREYSKHCITLGKQIIFFSSGVKREGKAVSIDPLGRLIVKTNEGMVTLFSGEVTTKIKKNFFKNLFSPKK